MDLSKIIELLIFTIPSIITGFIAYYFFKSHINSEENRMKLSLLSKNRKEALPIKLQAYERMTLFLERINPSNLLLRVTSINNDKNAYTQSLINTIETEFEHNLAQQIYISEKCWSVITASKNTTIQIIKKISAENEISNAQELREEILKKLFNNPAPSTTALAFIKNEVKNII